MHFRFLQTPIDVASARKDLEDFGAGGFVSFEGWVRDHNEGQEVTRLEYEAFEELAVKEGDRIVAEALRKFPIKRALCIHRVGSLALGEMAVWVGVSARHRQDQAVEEAGAHAVKLEGGRRVLPQVEALVAAGVPVMAHLGLTPQSVHAMSGYQVQGRGEQGERLLDDAKALEAAGAFAIVLEVVPAELAARITAAASVPTIGIGAGPGCDAQVLVWQDMAAFHPASGPVPKFVKIYAKLGDGLRDAANHFAEDVRSGAYPGPEHTYS